MRKIFYNLSCQKQIKRISYARSLRNIFNFYIYYTLYFQRVNNKYVIYSTFVERINYV
nr:MAG TPA: hypothetical protein [Caudoviricetes sp.]DAR73986.1 MAG TPA: hypothetical protein [Caudoviricetes sp.]